MCVHPPLLIQMRFQLIIIWSRLFMWNNCKSLQDSLQRPKSFHCTLHYSMSCLPNSPYLWNKIQRTFLHFSRLLYTVNMHIKQWLLSYQCTISTFVSWWKSWVIISNQSFIKNYYMNTVQTWPLQIL